MKASIEDVRLRFEPSASLVHFICHLQTDHLMPENLLRIRESCGIKSSTTNSDKQPVPNRNISRKQHELLQSILTDIDTRKMSSNNLNSVSDVKLYDTIDELDSEIEEQNKKLNQSSGNCENIEFKDPCTLFLNDIRWIYRIIEEQRISGNGRKFLHELLDDSKLILPKNQTIPRNPELEARCAKLREQQQEREYRNMTKDVDSTRQHLPEDTIAYQVKSINRQLVAVFQFVVSVITGFVFGFLGLEYMLGDLDFGFRLFMGVMCALIVALAEIYFLAKKLAEYDEPVEDMPLPKAKPKKPHQD